MKMTTIGYAAAGLKKEPLRSLSLLLVIFLFIQPAFASFPAPSDDYVNDFAGAIEEPDRKRIAEFLKNLEYSSGIEMTVVTVNSISEYGSFGSIEEFATGLFNEWGVGSKKENNGVMLLVSVKDRELRIELGSGYPSHYDSLMKGVIDNDIVPYFKEGQISRGIYEGVIAAAGKMTKKVSFWEYYWPHILGGVLVIVLLLAGLNMLKQGKKGWGYVFLAAAFILLMAIIKAVLSGKGNKGFGGGKSSGGGASGSW